MIVIEPWYWLVLGIVLLISEMFITTFATLWFGVAAIIVALIVWLIPIPELIQVVVWLILSIVMVFLWFKYIKPLAVDRTKSGLGGEVIIGEVGMITAKPQPDKPGTVRFSVPIVGATEWMCRTLGEEVEIGQRVIVVNVMGNELVVKPYQSIR